MWHILYDILLKQICQKIRCHYAVNLKRKWWDLSFQLKLTTQYWPCFFIFWDCSRLLINPQQVLVQPELFLLILYDRIKKWFTSISLKVSWQTKNVRRMHAAMWICRNHRVSHSHDMMLHTIYLSCQAKIEIQSIQKQTNPKTKQS